MSSSTGGACFSHWESSCKRASYSAHVSPLPTLTISLFLGDGMVMTSLHLVQRTFLPPYSSGALRPVPQLSHLKLIIVISFISLVAVNKEYKQQSLFKMISLLYNIVRRLFLSQNSEFLQKKQNIFVNSGKHS
jgi:hypothetical protein